ncbi:type II toxin-antitoxin system ParD family antitoxin [Dickeya oryzae]|nr:type II toxin-antitoxin system ParD family antitoxin [Dickeya oryzae]
MATSIALSPYFAQFIREQIDSGRDNNVSEVVSAEVREEREQQMTLDALRVAVELGVNSGPGKEA